MLELYEIHCGILPLASRFIVIDYDGTRWTIPASCALDRACEYYEDEDHGWYEQCELDEDSALVQLHGAELRGCLEVNADLLVHIRDTEWPDLKPFATRIAGSDDGPDDKCWWFEENGGTIEEMTDLPIEKQVPLRLLWFDDDYKQRNGIVV
mgnify:CR=1 FL=1